ncbi:MAG TPA: phytanoyl-CoA dioxygenase family protein [Methylomirabilota bacterium]|nr:phytanoyl-CoA dioxygenase family protein [Methylomirabilota bacterium]
MLSQAQVEQFWRDGYVVADGAVTPAQLTALKQELAHWVDESRPHKAPFGPPTIDGRPRFDMGEEHTAERPALRRVNNPSDVSPVYREAMEKAAFVDMVADLIGPDVKFHHCKINVKLPGSKTEVGYHQDFPYTPHTNDDIVTALLMLDDMTAENGCLTVVPGSHRGPLYSLFEGGRFVGYIEKQATERMRPAQVSVTGKAGSVCLMHTRLVHGSDANRSGRPRGLYICVYTAADAFPLARNPLANPNEGMIVRGHATRMARLVDAVVELPAQEKVASFFATQGQRSAAD